MIIIMALTTRTTTRMVANTSTEASVATLLVWFSPAFPIGAFAFSHGLEWAVEAGDIHDRASLEAWLAGLLSHGSGWTDAVLFACAHRAAGAGDRSALGAAATLAVALQPSSERRLEATMQGGAFVRAVEAGWQSPGVAMLKSVAEPPYALAVAAGAATADRAPTGVATEAFLTGFAGNLISATVRLAPIGQTDGLRALAALGPMIEETAARAATAGLDDLGGIALRSDLAAMRHETQVTRLFRA
jgi:urease accessory protein